MMINLTIPEICLLLIVAWATWFITWYHYQRKGNNETDTIRNSK